MHLYAIALGSNRRHHRHHSPRFVLQAALDRLDEHGGVIARSTIHDTAPIGPSLRRFANAAALLESALDPPAMLVLLKSIEREFGRRPGRRWGVRVLDLDLLLWSGGRWRSRNLSIPHVALAGRRFVLDPLVEIAPGWRLPPLGIDVRHAARRLTARAPLHRSGAVGP